MYKFFTKLNIVFGLQLIAVLAVIAFDVPREIFLFTAGIFVFYVAFSSLEESVLLVARSIPLFVALPITEHFDSMNMWRIIIALMFARWFFDPVRVRAFIAGVRSLAREARASAQGAFRTAWRAWRIETLSVALFLIACLSLFGASDLRGGIKRILLFVNLSMLFFIVRTVATKETFRSIALNVALSGAFVATVGFVQLLLAYTMHIDNFSEFWALTVNTALYGTAWANIAIAANTWFAYYSGTIHLRMFSSFPDTHSFPLYILMVAGFATTLLMFETKKVVRVALAVLLIVIMFEAVLSGTRGIWASIVFSLGFLVFLAVRKYATRAELGYAFAPLALFLISLPIAGIIFNSPQFQFTGTAAERKVFSERIKSIVDTEETSNQGRIFIWKETAKSIAAHPFLGVGIGNFPVVLALNPTATKAGASAHNLYLNFFAELGILGFIASSILIYELCRRAWQVFMAYDGVIRFFALNALLYLIWMIWYSMTDVAIFDERAYLLCMILLGTLFAFTRTDKIGAAR